MSDSELHKKTSEAKQPETQFKTENIGKWASKQENPFAEQNRKAAAKKQRESEQSQKAAPAVAIILGAAAVVAALCGLAVLIVFLISIQPKPEPAPVIIGDSTQDINDYRDILNEFYNHQPDASTDDRLQDVQDAVDSTMQTDNGQEYANQVLLAQILFYSDNSMYDRVISVVERINEDKLTDENKLIYYDAVYYAYAKIGNPELANIYLDKLYVLSNTMSGDMFVYYEEE